MSSAFSPHLFIRTFNPEGDSHLFTFGALYVDLSRINRGFRRVRVRVRYGVGSKFARGGWFVWVERAELMEII